MAHAELGTALRPLRALIRLVEASAEAESLGSDPWQLASTTWELAASGISLDDLRYLCLKDLIEVRKETTRDKSRKRTFGRSLRSIPRFGGALVVSKSGLATALMIRDLFTGSPAGGPNGRAIPPETPSWDKSNGELWFLGRLVKRLSRRAKDQRIIFDAEEEEGWPRHLDDPLPPKEGISPKTRLNNLIKKLNSHQISQLLEFHGDGTGEGLRWEPYDERHHKCRNMAPKRL